MRLCGMPQVEPKDKVAHVTVWDPSGHSEIHT